MNLHLKAIYLCATTKGKSGLGFTIEEAFNLAGLTTEKSRSTSKFRVTAIVLLNPSDEQMHEIAARIFPTDDLTPVYQGWEQRNEEGNIIGQLHVGFMHIATNIAPKKQKVAVEERFE